MTARQERRFSVRGRVQGVGFRWWTRGRAVELGLAGTVRNRPDGTVEVVVAGPPDRIDRLRELLHRGPPAARVEEVLEDEVTAGVVDGDDFRIVS